MMTLDTLLSQFEAEHKCLKIACEPVTVRELREKSAVLRKNLIQAQGACVVLCEQSPLALIEALLALDGVARAIFLLPYGHDSDIERRLIEEAQCDAKLEGGGTLTLLDTRLTNAELNHLPTRWLMATSGTTGVPKIVSHTFDSLTRKMKRDSGRGSSYTWGLMFDPSRFAGLQVVLQSLIGGSCLAVSSSLVFEDQVTAILEQQVNALSATPSLWRKLLMDGRVLDLPMKQITLGGESVDQSLLDGLRRLFPDARITHIYASTEAGASFAVNDCRAGFPAKWLNNTAAPVPLRINDYGHLLIKPAVLAQGVEIQSRLDATGYLDTQDIVRQLDDRVFFLGRASGAINVGGNKVHPEEVENLIRELPEVLDVCVFGKSNSLMGQLVVAELVMAAGTDPKILRQKIQRHCRAKLESWQCPALVTAVDQLQETVAGKRVRITG